MIHCDICLASLLTQHLMRSFLRTMQRSTLEEILKDLMSTLVVEQHVIL